MKLNDPYFKSVSESFLRGHLKKWSWLLEVSKQHSIDSILCEDLREFLEVITSLKKEGDPINVALAFNVEVSSLEKPLVQIIPFRINEHSKIANLKDSVNGLPLCYLLDHRGVVTIGQIPKKLLRSTAGLTIRHLSGVFQTLGICLNSCILEVNNVGKILRINRSGFWMEPCNIRFTDLQKEGFPSKLLDEILDLCMILSTNNHGGIIVITKNDFPDHRTALLKDHKFEKRKINEISTDQLLKFTMIDGAIILNTNAELVDIAQKLGGNASTKCFIESGRGSKHNSAAIYSETVDCVAFVVSHEGPITVYYKGQIYARCFGEIFGY